MQVFPAQSHNKKPTKSPKSIKVQCTHCGHKFTHKLRCSYEMAYEVSCKKCGKDGECVGINK